MTQQLSLINLTNTWFLYHYEDTLSIYFGRNNNIYSNNWSMFVNNGEFVINNIASPSPRNFGHATTVQNNSRVWSSISWTCVSENLPLYHFGCDKYGRFRMPVVSRWQTIKVSFLFLIVWMQVWYLCVRDQIDFRFITVSATNSC